MLIGARLSSITSNHPATKDLRCWAEVSVGALHHNLAALRTRAPGVGIMAVVKANAYGHGLPEITAALAGRVEMFGVANVTEARECARHAGGTPILLLGAALPGEREMAVREGFIPAISSLDEAYAYSALAKPEAGRLTRVHLAIDTGMGRMGAWPEEAAQLAKAIAALPGLELAGLCSHLPSADEDANFTRTQLGAFHTLVAELKASASGGSTIHVENSAGLIAFPAQAGTLARAGLALYGVSPIPEFQPSLRPVLTWKTRVLMVRDYPAGHGVSYGRTFLTPGPMRVATLAAGYADGVQRQMSGHGACVLIGGRRCPLLGRVTMDQIMVDVSAVPAVGAGDEAVLIGTQGGETISAVEMAGWAGTIPWHVFTSLGPRVVRVVCE